MARTLSAGETKVYASEAKGVHLDVRVKDEAASWVNLCDLEGHNFVEEVQHVKDIDAPVESATIRLFRSIYDFKLSPLYSASKINNPSGGAQERLGINREIVIRVAVMPAGSGEPAASDWRLIFHGDVDQIDVTGMTLQCVDLGGRLQRLRMERAAQPDATPGGSTPVKSGDPYVAAGTSEAAEDVMQAILDDWAPALSITLHTPSSPGWDLIGADPDEGGGYTPPADSNVLDALRSIASMIGWDVRYVFDTSLNDPITAAATGDFRLRFYEPPRTNITSDITLTSSQYRNITVLEDILATVANRVEVMYLNTLGVLCSVIAEDAASQTAFGVLYMRVDAEQIPGIHEDADAEDLAEAILHDVSDPTAAMGVDADFRYDVELYDLIRFLANGELWDSSQELAVSGVRHTFSEGRASTAISLRGTIAGHRAPWWQNGGGSVDDGLPGYDGPISDEPYGGGHTPPTPDLTHDVVLGGIQFRVPNPPTIFDRIEFHVSTSGAGFTPDSTTLVDSVAGRASSTVALTQGTTHYARAVVVGPNGFRSTPSTAVTFSPGVEIAQVQVQQQLSVTPEPTDKVPYAQVWDCESANEILNPSFEVNVTDGWTKDAADVTFTRDTTTFVWGDACAKMVTTAALKSIYSNEVNTSGSGDHQWAAAAWFAGNAGGEDLHLMIEGWDGAAWDLLGEFEPSITTEWERYAAVGAVDHTAYSKVRLRIKSSVAQTIFIDGVTLENFGDDAVEGRFPSSYIDGTLGPADGDAYSWAGTAHNSRSTRLGGAHVVAPLSVGRNQGPMVLFDSGVLRLGDKLEVGSDWGRIRLDGVGYGDGSDLNIEAIGNGFNHLDINVKAKGSDTVGIGGSASSMWKHHGAGASFPTIPQTDATFWRTDRGVLYYYDGTRWLSVNEYTLFLSQDSGTDFFTTGVTATTANSHTGTIPSAAGGTKVYVTTWGVTWWITGTNTTPTNQWTFGIRTNNPVAFTTFTTGGLGTGAWVRTTVAANSERTIATDLFWALDATKGGTAGTLFFNAPFLTYRLIG